jgi:hemolysin activation/secretion protein
VQGELQRGTRPGGLVLEVAIEEAPRFDGGLRLANDRAPAVGGAHGAIEGTARNVFGQGDVIDFVVGVADGLRDLDFRLNVPLWTHGTELSFRYFDADSELIDEEFAVLGAEWEATHVELGLAQSLYERAGREIVFTPRVASRQTESRLLGRPFSFSPGVENGKADIKVARLALQWIERGSRDYLSTRLTWSIGIGGLGATRHDDGRPDSRFHTLLAQGQWLHRFGASGATLLARADVQESMDPLLPLEKFVVGGTYSVRGYRRARFVRDNGWSASLEYRQPLLRLPVPGLSLRAADGQLALVAFVDAGRAWNEVEEADEPETLIAAGPGLRWDLRRGIRGEVYWGALRRRVADTGDDLQDDGIHIVLTARRSF